MLNTIIQLSLRYRPLVIVLSLVLLFYGSYLATQMPIDVFPDLDRPRVIIITECPGLATEEVETLVTQPIEVAVLGASGVQAVRSQSTAGLNVIYVEFSWETEIRTARQTIQERLSTIELPAGIRPQMTPPASIMGQIVIAGMYRQRGPHGGALAVVPNSPYVLELTGVSPVDLFETFGDEFSRDALTELVVDNHDSTVSSKESSNPSSNNKPRLLAYRVVDRHDPATWEQVSLEATERGLTVDQADAYLELNPADFQSDREAALELRTMADWVVRPQLLKIPGLAEVFIQGGDEKQFQVLVNPVALIDHGVTLQQVEHALGASNLNTSGGFAIQGETERPIRILGRLGPDAERVKQDLAKIPVKTNDVRHVLLEDVARIVESSNVKRGDGSINGHPGTVFTIVKQPHVDTRELTTQIAERLREIEASLPTDIVINSELFRLKNFIDRGVFNVGEALVIGATLVVLILFLFLLNFRTTFITLTAIPLSLVITTLVFRMLDMFTNSQLSINVMTLGGIAVAMGELVDDAIVDVENIFRRLKDNFASSEPRPALRVVYEASKEIRSAIVFGTVVVILVFLPLFALTGIEGRLFLPLGVAYIVSILASLIVSLTVTPVLSYYLLPQSQAAHREGDGLLLRALKLFATPLIRLSMFAPHWLLAVTWAFLVLAIWEFSSLGKNFLPQFDEGSILVNVTLPPGSSLEASNQVSAAIDKKFVQRQLSESNPTGEILHFVRRTGRAAMDEHALPVSAGEYILSMNPKVHHDRNQIIQDILQELREEVPGVDIEVEQPLAHLISHMVSGVYAQIAIKIVGDDLDKMLGLAEQVKQVVQEVPGVTPPVLEPIQMTPEIHIRLLPDELARYGVTRAYVAEVLQTALQGQVVSEVLEGQRRFDLLVRLEQAYRTDYANLGRLRIDLPEGHGQVELSSLASIETSVGPNAINRENARRRVVIRCNTQGRDLASAVQEIQRRIKQEVSLPSGYFVEFGGQFESQQRATATILILAGVSILGVFGVLMLLFPSVRIVLQILNALPTAFIGGVLALVITQQTLTVASLVGFISLGGIAVRNGILLVTHYLHLMREEGEVFGPQMILRGSLERLAPVLMTALTAGIGLAPLVWGGQEPGREILYPVATVILGGLITSTFCEFLIHPGLFLAFSGRDAEKLIEAEQSEVDF
ncbi:MAG: efflux RND transporter permease subunit [Planctomycetaceae bacterium]|nr:efflux RND transporter permease subunit [Planctomycetaceae bacterium]